MNNNYLTCNYFTVDDDGALVVENEHYIGNTGCSYTEYKAEGSYFPSLYSFFSVNSRAELLKKLTSLYAASDDFFAAFNAARVPLAVVNKKHFDTSADI